MTDAHETAYYNAMEADADFSENLQRQFGEDVGDRRYDVNREGWDAQTIEASERFHECNAALAEQVRLLRRGAVSLPLLAFQACIGIGLASGVAAVVTWAQGVIGGAL